MRVFSALRVTVSQWLDTNVVSELRKAKKANQQPHSASPGFAKYRLEFSRSLSVADNSSSASRAAATRRLFSRCGTRSHTSAFELSTQPKSDASA